MLSLAAAFIALRPVAFPGAPLPYEVRRGAAVCRAGKGMDRVGCEDRQVLGLWFDGRARRDVEDVVWLSPSYISRCLGYLQEKERWFDGELERRWTSIRSTLVGRVTLVVRLSAFPKWVDSDYGLPGKGNADEVDTVRWLWTAGPMTTRPTKTISVARAMRDGGTRPAFQVEPTVTLLRRSTSRSAQAFEAISWLDVVPFGSPLRPEFWRPAVEASTSLGSYHAAWYLVQLPVPPGLRAQAGWELHVFTPAKERVGRFELVLGRR